MEKAVLKTLIYADIFDYPLTIFEIHKWLIGKKVHLRDIEKVLKRKSLQQKVTKKDDYFFLSSRKGLVKKRVEAEKHSKNLMLQAKIIANLFRLIPYIKLVGISGSLSVSNARRGDDIDFFIVTGKDRLWICRILILGILELIGKRRKKEDRKSQVSGKACVNLILEEDQLEQKYKDLYTAHEVLQMKVLWDRDNTYSKFLDANSWVFEKIPNFTVPSLNSPIPESLLPLVNYLEKELSDFAPQIVDFIEDMVKDYQLKKMGRVEGGERIEESVLYFHPEDKRKITMDKFKKAT